jgi:ribosome-associated toxin RatA of RatAB toxin-antitoxin module
MVLHGVIALALVLSQVETAHTNPEGEKLTRAQQSAIEGGEVLVALHDVKDTAIKRVVAITVIDAPREEIYAVLADFEKLSDFMPYCTKVKVKKREGKTANVHFLLDFPWPVGDRFYTLAITDTHETVDEVPAIVSRWKYVKDSGNVNAITGSWELLAYDDTKTYVRYTIFTDPGGHLPVWARNRATKTAVPNTLNSLREKVMDNRNARKEAADKDAENAASSERSAS